MEERKGQTGVGGGRNAEVGHLLLLMSGVGGGVGGSRNGEEGGRKSKREHALDRESIKWRFLDS